MGKSGDLLVSDLVYSSATKRCYATTSSNSKIYPSTLVIIDPNLDAIEKIITIGKNPGKLALSDDGSMLYVALDGGKIIQPIELASNTLGKVITLGIGQFGYTFTVRDMTVIRGNPNALAVSKSLDGFKGGVSIFDNGIPRPISIPEIFNNIELIQSGETSDVLYGFSSSVSDHTFTRLKVSSQGVSIASEQLGAASEARQMTQAGGNLFFSSGEVLRGLDGAMLGKVGAGGEGFSYWDRSILPDPSVGRIYLGGPGMILVYDMATFRSLGSIKTGASLPVTKMVRWGEEGLVLITASNSTDGKIVLLSTSMPKIAQFKASAAAITKGQNLTLSWDVVGATDVSIPGLTGISGMSVSVCPSQTTNYQLFATAASATSNADVTVVVDPGPGPRPILSGVKDILFCPATSRLYASLPGSAGSSGNSIAIIDPTTGANDGFIAVGSDPGTMALSEDGETLYVALDGTSGIQRVNLRTREAGLKFGVGFDQSGGRKFVRDLAVLPGLPDTVVVSTGTIGIIETQGVAVFDNGIPRPVSVPNGYNHSEVLVASDRPDRLFSGDRETIQSLELADDGIRIIGVLGNPCMKSFGPNNKFVFQSGRLFTPAGDVFEAGSGIRLGTFPPAMGFSVAPDLPAGKIYFAGNGTVGVFDSETFHYTGAIQVGMNPNKILRFGADGLALLGDGKVVLTRVGLPTISSFGATSDVIEAGQSTTLSWEVSGADTVTVSGVGNVSGSTLNVSPGTSSAYTLTATNCYGSVSAQVMVTVKSGQGAMSLVIPSNDIVFSPLTQRLYASIPSSAGLMGNSIAIIDPVRASVVQTIFVGSEPNKLALSEDGATLYVALDGQAAIRSIDLLSRTASQPFLFSTSPELLTAQDIQFIPGSKDTLAIAKSQLGTAGYFPRGVSIFDHGILRPTSTPDPIDGQEQDLINVIESDGSTDTLIGYNGYSTEFGIRVLKMTADGVSVKTCFEHRTMGFFVDMAFRQGKLFFTNGDVLNATDLTPLGLFPANGPVEPDVTENRVYFGTSGAISRFDLTNFRTIGAIPVGVTPTKILRWGQDGLAAIGDGKLVLARTQVPVITQFSASHGAVVSGTSVKLSWKVSGATSLELSGVGPVSGTECSVVPTTNVNGRDSITYTLTAMNEFGSATAEVKLILDPAIKVADMGLAVQDLAYSSLTNRIYASISGSVNGLGNGIAILNPDSATIEDCVFVGSAPSKIAMADDNRTLWMALDGSGTLRSLDVLTKTLSSEFRLPIDSWAGQLRASHLAPIPGMPNSLAVVFRMFGLFSTETTVAVFDNGLQRSKSLKAVEDATPFMPLIEVSASGEKLYAFNNESTGFDYSVASISPEGLNMDSTFPLKTSVYPFGGDLTLAGGRMYCSWGDIIDPDSGERIGSCGNNPWIYGNAILPDLSDQAIYLSVENQVMRFDSSTFQAKGTLDLGFNCKKILRFAEDGLALLSADTGLLYLIRTSQIK